MMQIRLLLAVTVLLSVLSGITIASSVPGNVSTKRKLKKGSGGSPGYMSKKSKKMSNKDDNRLKASKKGSANGNQGGNQGGGDGANGNGDDPTGASSPPVEVPADVFQLYYKLSESREPTPEEYEALSQMTGAYLEEYMSDAYGDGLDIFSTFMVFQEYTAGEPVRVDYRSFGSFRGDLSPMPTTAELNNLIAVAFSGPNLQNYLANFNNLPSGNPFETTSEVAVEQKAEAQSETEESPPTGTVAAAVAGSLVLIAGVACCARKKKNKQGSDADDADKLNGEGSDAGTVAAGASDAGTVGPEGSDAGIFGAEADNFWGLFNCYHPKA